jgi:hypothetical protein
MSRYLFLDTGLLGMVTNPKASGVTLECQLWLNDQLLKRAVILAHSGEAPRSIRFG